MVVRDLNIDRAEWRVRIFYAVTCYHTEEIVGELAGVDCPEEIVKRVRGNLERCEMDTGFTYSNKGMRRTVMVIGLHSSPDEFLNSLSHELRHLADDMAGVLGLSPGGEEVAYLTGDIFGALSEDIRLFVCDCSCHREELDKRLKCRLC
ncbi:MAG: hypothetical protein PUB21_08075 [Bacteroidales bacterium]|nr:hypothetical protein [Bacteroidales bacterium]